MSALESKVLANIVRVEIATIEAIPRKFRWETSSKASIKPFVSEGSEEILRVKNSILATNRYEDIVVGYDLEFEDNAFVPEVFALIDGGTLIYNELDPNKLERYDAPVVGLPVNRKLFNLSIYTEEKDIDGMAKSYAKLQLNNCKGKPAEFELEDGKFMVPKFSVASRPKAGESPTSLDFLDVLPDEEPPVITPIASANVKTTAAGTWTAPVAKAMDSDEGDISSEVITTYSSDDSASSVSSLATARTHLGTIGNTVKVTYSVTDTAGNVATPVVAVFTAIA